MRHTGLQGVLFLRRARKMLHIRFLRSDQGDCFSHVVQVAGKLLQTVFSSCYEPELIYRIESGIQLQGKFFSDSGGGPVIIAIFMSLSPFLFFQQITVEGYISIGFSHTVIII